MSESKY